MDNFPAQPLAKIFIILGIALVVLGIMILYWGKIPIIGKLPGDIVYKHKNFTFYLPITSIILLNLLLFLILYFFRK